MQIYRYITSVIHLWFSLTMLFKIVHSKGNIFHSNMIGKQSQQCPDFFIVFIPNVSASNAGNLGSARWKEYLLQTI